MDDDERSRSVDSEAEEPPVSPLSLGERSGRSQ
eukprot:CAMPEP_0119285542 /NCGR_PEP_ID=MMETSP1329-20130426/32403_1 /TAXON_ID=114041 /ORGANISM="Genus nov. species nov., Strain RCC1024" /LENGTH=32 /DNA_ID= /DNA_START= /DNA_END= /DNA_ORIENTATION=